MRERFVNRSIKEGYLISELINLNPSHPDLDNLLSKFSNAVLFCIALQSQLLFNTIKHFLSSRMPKASFWNTQLIYEKCPDTPILNWDVILVVMDHLDLAGLRTISSGAKWLHDHARKRASRRWRAAFKVWGLDWETVQWFLDMTGTVISGLTSTSLLFPNRRTLDVGCLDFYVQSDCEKAVQRFFKLAGPFKVGDIVAIQTPYISKTIIFNHIDEETLPVPLAIHIVVAHSDPREAVFRQDSTAMFTHVCATSITVPYSALTFSRETMPNHPFVHLCDPTGLIHLRRLKSMSCATGFELVSFHKDRKQCGDSLYCPSIVRTSADGHSATFWFVDPTWTSNGGSSADDFLVIWSLGRMGCRNDMLRCEAFIDVVEVEEINESNEKLWLDRFEINTSSV